MVPRGHDPKPNGNLFNFAQVSHYFYWIMSHGSWLVRWVVKIFGLNVRIFLAQRRSMFY